MFLAVNPAAAVMLFCVPDVVDFVRIKPGPVVVMDPCDTGLAGVLLESVSSTANVKPVSGRH